MNNELICVIGKSGSGKNFLCDKWGLKSIPSNTTRPMRPGEENGREHVFVPEDDIPVEGYFACHSAAYTFFNGYHYWTIFEQLEDKRYNVYIIDVKGIDYLFQYKEIINRNIKVFYINSPWYTRLYRMWLRGDGILKTIKRFINDQKEFADFESVLSQHDIKEYYQFEN
jgi:guanylate kinase